jgi:hypothetical protein
LRNESFLIVLALSCASSACTFKAPDANKPLGCACDPRPNAFAYCKYDACNYAGCHPGFFDLDGDPTNGCETERSRLPGNLVFAMERDDRGYWDAEFDRYDFESTDGFATATVADPTCKPTAIHSCNVRLEAFQVSFTTAVMTASAQVKINDVIVSTTGPVDLVVTGNGANVLASDIFASFSADGDRTPLLEAKGSLNVYIAPYFDGTVRLIAFGSFQGYVADRLGDLDFTVHGQTRQLFDASAPDTHASDAANEADVSLGDASIDDGPDLQ